MAYPPVQCLYSTGRRGAAYHRKVWLNVGTTRRLFEIGLLENFIHYGLDMRNHTGTHGPLGPLDPWAVPYKSPEDELADAPGRLPKSLRRGLLDILPRLHQRGFLIFHDEALKTQPRRAKTHQPGYPVMNSANLAVWYRHVMRDGDWRLTPMAYHLFTAARAWLAEQPIFADSGALSCFNLSDAPLPQDTIDKLVAHCTSMGTKAKIVANRPLPPGGSGLSGPHLWIEHDPLPGTYWLKQEDRAEDHILEGVWEILEAWKGSPVEP